MTKIAVPTTFGSGGAGLTPNRSSAVPSLAEILAEHSLRGLDKVTVSFTAADVAAPNTDGTALSKVLAAALATGRVLVGSRIRHVTAWAGGGLATMLLTVGDTDTDAIIDDFDMMGVPVTTDAPAGVKPQGLFTGAINAIITPDGASKVSDATAGETHVDLYFVNAF